MYTLQGVSLKMCIKRILYKEFLFTKYNLNCVMCIVNNNLGKDIADDFKFVSKILFLLGTP